MLQSRRNFLAKITAIFAAAAALAAPAAVGIVAFFHPLRRKNRLGDFVRVTTLEAVPEDGTPQKFPVIADRTDAWNFFPREPVGAVYLQRAGINRVEALQVICPHAGCSIQIKTRGSISKNGTTNSNEKTASDGYVFFCPCHEAGFDPSGKRLDAASPSPRDMDALEVEIQNKNEVWVKFQKFLSGTANKIAQA